MLYGNEEERLKLEKLLVRRKLKGPLTRLLKAAKEEAPKGSKLRYGGNLNYAAVIEELKSAITNKWLDEAKVTELLSSSEIAGNQHVMLFHLPDDATARQAHFDAIGSPTGLQATAVSVNDFVLVPTNSTYEILSKTSDEVTVKIVAERDYWITNPLDDDTGNPDRRLQELLRMRERCPIIIRASLTTGLTQLRVAPRQRGGTGSANSHYSFLVDALQQHYQLNHPEGWFRNLKSIPIADTFGKLVGDVTTLVTMWSDTPENRDTATSMKNKGRPTQDKDLRDGKDWDHAIGYARKSISGYFSCGDDRLLFGRLHDDRIKIEKGTQRGVARLFVPRYCTDGDLENAISGIRTHL